jgi:N-acetylmuramoyl-L-alanine amidase
MRIVALISLIAVSLFPFEAKAIQYEQSEVDCLAKNIYFEARGESEIGQYAVGMVTLNRLDSPDFPDTICEVVTEAKRDANGNPILHKCQFSWFCDGKSDTPKHNLAWDRAVIVAKNLILFRFPDITQGAVFYHAKSVSPYWKKHFTFVRAIDNHLFYTEK